MASYITRHLQSGWLAYEYRTSKADLLDSSTTNQDELVIPRVYGRAFVKPIPQFTSMRLDADSTYHNMSTALLTKDTAYTARPAIDCVLALCQAGVTIQGVKRAGDFVGLKKNTSGTWSAANSSTVLQAIRRLARFDLVYPVGFNPSGPNGVGSPSQPVPSGIEVITGAASPWGYRQDSSPSNPDAWTTLTGGTNPPAWGYLVGSASEGMAWAGLAHIRFEELTLDQSGRIPDMEFLVDGVGGGPDCSPSTAIRDVLVNLIGIPDANVITNEGPDGLYASSFDAYAAAVASTFALNCSVTGSAREILDELLLACNAEIVQLPGGRVKVLSLSDQPAGSYVPCAVSYVIDETDILGDELLSMETRERGECFNAIPVRYKDATKGFEDAIYTWRDEFDSAQYGRRTGPSVSNRWITSSQHAMLVSQTLTRRSLNERRRINFKLPPHYCLLEPGDLVTVSDRTFPAITIRILSIDENDDYGLEVEGWEWSGAVTPIDITPEVLPQAVQAQPDALQAAAEILGQQTAAVADGKAAQDLSDVDDGAVLERHIADDAVTVAKLNVTTLSSITANLGTVTAGTLDVSGSLYIGSRLVSATAIPVVWGWISFNNGAMSWSTASGNIVSVGVVNIGFQVVAITLSGTSTAFGLAMVCPYAVGGNGIPHVAGAVISGSNSVLYVGMRHPTTSAWLDPNSTTGKFGLLTLAGW